MSLFKGNYLEDEEIWSRIEEVEGKVEEIQEQLAQPEVSTQPNKLAQLSKRLDSLKKITEIANQLRCSLEDLEEAKNMAEGDDPEAVSLVEEYRNRKERLSERLFQLMVNGGFLPEEEEDEIDIGILRYIRKVGPEYAWGLARAQNMETKEARERLKMLLEKGLLERVQGTMLESYHRKDGWDKHMNHTYYRLSRKGEHYLRKLDRDTA